MSKKRGQVAVRPTIHYRCSFSNTIRNVLQGRGWKEGEHDGDVSGP